MKSQIKAALFGLFNAMLMLVLCLYWLSLPRTFGDEAFLIKWTSLVKKTLLGFDQKPDPNSVLYIDVSRSMALIGLDDPIYDEDTGLHSMAITDREALAEFMDYVREFGSDIPVMILDLTFERSSPSDSLFQAAIDSFPFPIVSARRILADGSLNDQAVSIPTGIASYLSPDNQFLKYPLFLDGLPSLPLVAHGIVSGESYEHPRIWPRINDKAHLINPIIDFKIRPIDLTDGSGFHEDKFVIWPLGTVLLEKSFWDPEDMREFLSNKTIIVGNFREDLHNTVFGVLPGPVVIHNVYLTISAGESKVKWSWILLLFFFFFWMSRRIYLEEKSGRRSKWWQRSKTAVGKIIADSIDDSFFLIIGTILSYLIFNIHINILVLLIYLKIMAFILKRYVFKKPAV